MGLTHLSTYSESPFCTYFVIFSYARHFSHILLSLLFYKAFAKIIFLSLKCFTVFFFMGFLIVYMKTFPLEMAGGQIGESTYALREGVQSKRTYACDGEEQGGQIFANLVHT